MTELIPVSEETLERVRSGKPLRDVGRIDLRGLGDRLTFDAVVAARHTHCLSHREGHEAPIRIREVQVKHLAALCGYGAKDEDGNPIDFTKPGSRIYGHELWVDGDPETPTQGGKDG